MPYGNSLNMEGRTEFYNATNNGYVKLVTANTVIQHMFLDVMFLLNNSVIIKPKERQNIQPH